MLLWGPERESRIERESHCVFVKNAEKQWAERKRKRERERYSIALFVCLFVCVGVLFFRLPQNSSNGWLILGSAVCTSILPCISGPHTTPSVMPFLFESPRRCHPQNVKNAQSFFVNFFGGLGESLEAQYRLAVVGRPHHLDSPP